VYLDYNSSYSDSTYTYTYTTFNMTGGSITNNTSTARWGGYGGGVYMSGGTFNLSGGVISGNTAAKNTANNYYGRGGGVYLTYAYDYNTSGHVNATFNMTGGTITGNKAGLGGGVYGADGTVFNLSGSVEIYGNTQDDGATDNNVYLNADNVINVTGKLTNTHKIGVTMHLGTGTFTNGYTANQGSSAPSSVFSSDYSAYDVELTSDGAEAQLTMDENDCVAEISTGSNTIHFADFDKAVERFNTTGGTLSLMKDISLDENVEFIRGGTLNLNGKVLTLNNYYIQISSGTITLSNNETTPTVHNYTDNNGLYSVGSGTDQLSGGIITGGTGAYGIYVSGGGLTMNGGVHIVGNSTENGAVHVAGTFNLSGNGGVYGNTYVDLETPYDVYLESGKVITITEALSNTIPVGVVLEEGSGTFTSGYDTYVGKETAADTYFVSDDDTFLLSVDTDSGEAIVVENSACVAEVVINGKVSHFTDFESALLTYNGASDTVKTLELRMTADAALAESAVFSKSGTFALYGHVLTLGAYNIQISAGYSVTFINGENTPTEYAYNISSYLYVLNTSGTAGTLSGGVITGGTGSAAAIVVNGDLIIEDNVNIAGNYTSNAKGGAVFVATTGSLTMTGGLIGGNKVTGVGTGVGVYISSGTFNMSGNASIYANYTTSYTSNSSYGGGVCIDSGALNMSDNATISANTSYRGGGVYTGNGVMINMSGNASIDGNYAYYVGGAIAFGNGSTFIMNDNASISRNYTTYTNGMGGAIYASGTSSSYITITINGGSIAENYTPNNGGAMYLSYCTLTMLGGEIRGNHTTSTGSTHGGAITAGSCNITIGGDASISENYAYFGGGVYFGGGAFTMNGGKINNNYVYTSSASYPVYGGGVYFGSGTFVMNDGEICNNKATTKAVAYAYGGGVYVGGGTFTMNGGKIDNNTTTYSGSSSTADWLGGGVYIKNGTFEMNGGEINENTAYTQGGGVYLYSGTFTLNGGEISDNTAQYAGGGVYIWGTFTMTGGAITGNTSTVGGDYIGGGGLYAYSGTITLGGGKITNNFAAQYGGGVYVYPNTVTLQGNIEVYGNMLTDGETTSNIYLRSNITLIVSQLSNQRKIGITMANKTGTFTSGFGSNNSGIDPAYYFESDSKAYLVSLTDGGEAQLYINEDYCIAEVTTTDGVTVHHVDFEDALATFNSNYGSTMILLDNVKVAADVEFKRYGTINLNGKVLDLNKKVITVTSGWSGQSIKFINQEDTLTPHAYHKDNSTGLYEVDGSGRVTGTLYGGVITGGYTSVNLISLNSSYANITIEDGVNIVGNSATGNLICLNYSNTYFYMNGGTISGNSAGNLVYCYYWYSQTTTTGSGSSAKTTTTKYYKQKTYCYVNGGEISDNVIGQHIAYVGSYGYFYLNGGKISNNYTYSTNVSIVQTSGVNYNSTNYNAYFYMNGGEISGNESMLPVYLHQYCEGAMTSGKICNNKSQYYSGGVWIYSATFTMSGGEISGNSFIGSNGCGGIYDSGTFKLSGNAEVYNNTKGGGDVSNVYLNSYNVITITGALTNTKPIGITCYNDTRTFTSGYGYASGGYNQGIDPAKYFSSDKTSYTVALDSTGAEAALVAHSTTCAAEVSEDGVVGHYDTFTDALDAYNASTATTLKLTLLKDATLEANALFKQSGTFDLNGCILTLDSYYIYIMNGTITMTDSTTTTEYGYDIGSDGTYVWNNAGSETLYGGVIYGGASDNGGILIADVAAFIMEGGSIISYNGNSSAVYVNGSFELNGGTIAGNAGQSAVYVNGSSFTMTDGSIENNIGAEAGAVYVKGGTFTLENGTISGNVSAGHGGGVYFNGGTLTVQNGSITGNTSANSGAGVFVDGSASSNVFELSGGAITGNTLDDAANTASNVYLDTDQLITIMGVLTKGKKIGITMASAGTFTSGFDTFMTGFEPANYFSSDDATNYYVSATDDNEGKLVSAKKTNTVTNPAIIDWTYGETASTPSGATATGGTVYYVYRKSGTTDWTKWASGAPKTAGAYDLKACVDDNGSYAAAESGVVNFNINKRQISVTINNQSGMVGDTQKTLTAAVGGAGLASGDVAASVFTLSTTANMNVAGDYDITGTQKDTTNYDTITFSKGTYSVKVFDETTCVAEVTINGNVSHYTSFEAALAALNGASGATLKLTGDVTLKQTADFTADGTLDLNGHTLTLGEDIQLTVTSGTLTLQDSSADGKGTITGAELSTVATGSVYVGTNGTLKMTGGTIAGNEFANNGLQGTAGVYVDGTFIMSGGAITNNTSSNSGAGVYVNNGTIALKSHAEIYGNTKDGTTTSNSDVYLPDSKVITVGSKLQATHAIGVTMATAGTFTSGYSQFCTADPSTYFKSDDSAYTVTLDNGEAMLYTHQSDCVAEVIDGSSTTHCTTYEAAVTEFNKTTSKTATLKLMANITGVGTSAQTFTVDGTLDLNGYILNLNMSTSYSGIIVDNNATLKLTDSNPTSVHYYTTDSNGYYVFNDTVTSGSVFNGGVIIGDYLAYGAITVNSGATLNMTAGAISGNTSTSSSKYPYAVIVNGTFNMSGGQIVGRGGYGVKTYSSTAIFQMTGGTISNMGSDGVYNYYGSFVLDGGEISDNSSYGVRVISNATSFTMKSGTISNNGTGVYSQISFEMNGGTISNNGDYGVTFALSKTFTMNGGTISGNGTGVAVGASGSSSLISTFIMNDGTVSGNEIGVYVLPNGIFTMKGGTVANNATTTDGYGGGVVVYYSFTSSSSVAPVFNLYGEAKL
jgi:hypothetical protein